MSEDRFFPELVDNTVRSHYRTCGEFFRRRTIQGWDTATPSIHLHAGGAFAHGLEKARRAFHEQGLDEAHALRDGLAALIQFYGPIQAPVTKTGDKSLENVIRAYDSYFKTYPLATDPIRPFKTSSGRYMIEFTFSIPTGIMHPVTGNPILYGGRSDMIGELNGALFVTDEKTASQLGEQWSNNWELDSQFTGYVAAAKMYGYPVAGALVRGVGLLKSKISHAECLVYRSDWEIERWWDQLHRDLARMVSDWKANKYDYALDKSACNAYGGCQYRMLCSSLNPDQWLPIHFRQNRWNPLDKDMGAHLLDDPKLIENLLPPELDIPELLAAQRSTK